MSTRRPRNDGSTPSGLATTDSQHHHGTETARVPTRTLVLHPDIRLRSRNNDASGGSATSKALRTADERLTETVGLAAALDLDIRDTGIVRISRIQPGTLFGTGKVEEIAALVRAGEIELVVVNAALSPVQQRNLEKAWNAKVLDRTALILEIFAARARTREGQLQVELAQLSYQKSRLVRSWTHLERQRGGLGFVGGPGETQIEADRRMIQDRISAIRQDLDAVTRTRTLHRESRARVPFPVIALVGYTNAGKSTLFNRLTDADVRAEDMLFATLDPTMRRIALPHGAPAILSDTVGFISELPTDLVAAFRATLEEVVTADLILHVRDISHPATAAEAEDVLAILADLRGEEAQAPVLEVWNKIDRIGSADARRDLQLRADARDDVVAVSALTGEGIEPLLAAMEATVTRDFAPASVVLDPSEGKALHWIYENCEVLSRTDRDGGEIALDLRVPAARRERFERIVANAKAA